MVIVSRWMKALLHVCLVISIQADTIVEEGHWMQSMERLTHFVGAHIRCVGTIMFEYVFRQPCKSEIIHDYTRLFNLLQNIFIRLVITPFYSGLWKKILFVIIQKKYLSKERLVLILTPTTILLLKHIELAKQILFRINVM